MPESTVKGAYRDIRADVHDTVAIARELGGKVADPVTVTARR